jgi:succinoglycan biosynthesis protein ExoM
VLRRQPSFPYEMLYVHEPIQNIARARNAALRVATGDIIVFADDDQLLPPEFLQTLDQLWDRTDDSVGAILGSVRAVFPTGAPKWLVGGGFFDRRMADGAKIPGSRMRTGGVALRRRVIEGHPDPFDAKWGLTGGEDNAFFDWAARRGEVFVGSAALEVSERVTDHRACATYVLQDSFRKGMCHARLVIETQSFQRVALYAVRSLLSAAAATAMVAIVWIRGPTPMVRSLALWARQTGKLFALLGGTWSAYGR